MKILRILIILLLPTNLLSQDTFILGNSFEKFIMQPHPKVNLAYGNLSLANSNYIITSRHLLGLNTCGTQVVLVNKFNGLIIDRFDLSKIGLTKYKQLKGFECKYNYLLNAVFHKIKQVEINQFILGIVKKKGTFFYLKIEIKENKIQHSLEQIDAFNSTIQTTKKERKEINEKIFPKCFQLERFRFFSYAKNIFYYDGDPLAGCISNKKGGNDSLVQHYYKKNVLYHNDKNKMRKIKSYLKKDFIYSFSEDVNYVYYHNKEDLLVIDKNGNILLDEKLNHFFNGKDIGFIVKDYGEKGIYAITYKKYILNHNAKLTLDTLRAEIYTLEYDSSSKKLIIDKKHTIISNYPAYCSQIEGDSYYFQHSFIKKNKNIYAVKLKGDNINVITKYPEKNSELFNVKNLSDFDNSNPYKEFMRIDSAIINYFKEDTFFNYPKSLKTSKKNNKYKNNTETQLIESILMMIDDTSMYENLFENYIMYEEGSKALESDVGFRALVNKLKTEEYLFLIEELREDLKSLLRNRDLLAEYKNIKAYGNKAINKNLSNGTRFYPFIKRENKYYIYLSAPIIEN